MKKIVLALVVLMCTAPAWAEVIITAEQVGDTNEVMIRFNAENELNLVRAFGLNIQLDDDANIIGVGYVNPDYYIHPGTIFIDTSGQEVQIDYGTPIAEYEDLVTDTLLGLGSNGVTIEMASLYYPPDDPGHPNAPAKSGDLLSIFVSRPTAPDDLQTCLTITGNVARAGSSGVVMEDPDEDPTVTVPVPNSVCVDFVALGCFDPDHSDYEEWLAVGEPECWCYKYQCYGDADGKRNGSPFTGYSRVRVEDLSVLISAWKKPVGDPDEDLCADFDRKLNGSPFTGYSRVRVEDLSILITNWKDDSGIPMADPGCGGDIDLTP